MAEYKLLTIYNTTIKNKIFHNPRIVSLYRKNCLILEGKTGFLLKKNRKIEKISHKSL